MNDIKPMAPKTRFYRKLALFSHLSLIAWMAIWYFVLGSKFEYSAVFVLLVYIVPLLFPLHGVVSGKPYTHAWACFIVLYYFLHAITVLYAEPEFRWHAGLELALATSMFIGCSMFARLRGVEMGTSLKKLSVVMKEEKEYFEKRNTTSE